MNRRQLKALRSGMSDQPALLARLVNEYARLAPTHLTGTPGGEHTSAWLRQHLLELSNAYAIDEQQFVISPEPWVPRGFEESGCALTLDGESVPCYPVHRLPTKTDPLDNVPMHDVGIREDEGYELSAAEVATGAQGKRAVIVINSWGGNRTTQPRPCDSLH